jgi:hypothetical protein
LRNSEAKRSPRKGALFNNSNEIAEISDVQVQYPSKSQSFFPITKKYRGQ